MNKVILPSILVATALFAGAFALMPVEDASAVHTTIQGTQMNDVNGSASTNCIADVNTNSLVATSDKDFDLHLHVHADAGATTAATVSDGSRTITLELLDNTGISTVLSFPGGTSVTVTDDATNDASACATIITESGGTATVT